MSKRGDAFDPTEILKARISTSGHDSLLSSDATSATYERTSQSGGQPSLSSKKYRPSPSPEEAMPADVVTSTTTVRRPPTKVASRRGDLFDPSSLTKAFSSMPPVIYEVVGDGDRANSSSTEITTKAKDLARRIDEMEKKLEGMDMAYEIAEDLLKTKEAAIIQAEAKLELTLEALSEAERAAEEAKARRKVDEKASEDAAVTTNDLLNAAMSASEERVRDERVIADLEKRRRVLELSIARLQQ